MERDRSANFLYAFLNPTPELLGTYLIGLFVVGIGSNWLYDILSQTNDVPPRGHLIIAAITVLGLLIAGYLWRQHWTVHRPWSEGQELAPQVGVVTIIPSNEGLAKTLLKHHRSRLKHLWLIGDFTLEPFRKMAEETLPKLQTELGLTFETHRLPLNRSNGQETYYAVREAFHQALNSPYDLSPDQVVFDITSGTKEMTAGAVLACATNGWSMSYILSSYASRPDGKGTAPEEGTSKVIAFDIGFVAPYIGERRGDGEATRET